MGLGFCKRYAVSKRHRLKARAWSHGIVSMGLEAQRHGFYCWPAMNKADLSVQLQECHAAPELGVLKLQFESLARALVCIAVLQFMRWQLAITHMASGRSGTRTQCQPPSR